MTGLLPLVVSSGLAGSYFTFLLAGRAGLIMTREDEIFALNSAIQTQDTSTQQLPSVTRAPQMVIHRSIALSFPSAQNTVPLALYVAFSSSVFIFPLVCDPIRRALKIRTNHSISPLALYQSPSTYSEFSLP